MAKIKGKPFIAYLLDQLVEATAIELSETDIKYLEELYHPVENLLSIGTS